MSVILQAAIELYMERHAVTRRGHVEFIGFAQRRMKEYGVHRDLEAYKRLFDVFPKGNFSASHVHTYFATYFSGNESQLCA